MNVHHFVNMKYNIIMLVKNVREDVNIIINKIQIFNVNVIQNVCIIFIILMHVINVIDYVKIIINKIHNKIVIVIHYVNII